MIRGRAGLWGFVALSGALHLAAFGWLEAQGGAEAAGETGEALVSIEAAEGALADLVAAWEAPPPVVDASLPSQILPAPAPETPPEIQPETPPEPPAAPPPPSLAMPLPDSLPAIRPPEPAPRPKPVPPKPRREPPRAAQKAGQKAAGSGGGVASGNRGGAEASTATQSQIDSARGKWGAAIRARIEAAKRTPAGARPGSVRVVLTLDRAGVLRGARVGKGSGQPELDRAAVLAVRRAHLPAAPAALTRPSYTFNVTLTFGY